jgi:hypothetical protein
LIDFFNSSILASSSALCATFSTVLAPAHTTFSSMPFSSSSEVFALIYQRG